MLSNFIKKFGLRFFHLSQENFKNIIIRLYINNANISSDVVKTRNRKTTSIGCLSLTASVVLTTSRIICVIIHGRVN
jgi:hypothetical protein